MLLCSCCHPNWEFCAASAQPAHRLVETARPDTGRALQVRERRKEKKKCKSPMAKDGGGADPADGVGHSPAKEGHNGGKGRT